MTPDRTDANPDENAEHGVLEDGGNLDTASITILGGHIAQVNVDLPVTGDDDDLDDDVIEDEIPLDEADLAALDAPRLPSAAPADDHADVVHHPHVEQIPTGDIIIEPHHTDADEESFADDDVHDAEIVDETPRGGSEHEIPDADHPAAEESVGDEVPLRATAETSDDLPGADGLAEGADESRVAAEAENLPADDPAGADDRSDDDVPAQSDPVETERRTDDRAGAEIVDDVELLEADAAEPVDAFDDVPLGAHDLEHDHASVDPEEPGTHDEPATYGEAADIAEPLTRAPWIPAASDEAEAGSSGIGEAHELEPGDATPEDAEPSHPEPEDVADDGADDAEVEETKIVAQTPADATQPVDAPRPEAAAEPQTAASTAAAEIDADAAVARAGLEAAPASAPAPTTRAERAATGVIGTIPLTRRGAQQADDAARVDRSHSLERVRTPAPEVTLASKRIGQIDDARESSDLLTADRLLDPRQITRPEPEGLWQQLVYSVSRHRINLGDGRRARQRKDLDRRIAAPLAGGARFVPVLSRKGGVGKTTVTSLLGMALADARDDRIIAVDANPDRGTLADRVGRANGRTVRDLVRSHDEMVGYNDVSSIVARDATRLDVLASDSDPRVSEAFSDEDYRQVADVAAHYYSIVLTDTGTGIVHSVMGATLELADTLVIVAGLSVDEARLASETLTWLETNGYASRVRDAVVVLNTSRPGTPLVRENELEAHFRSRVRTVIRMPYDARIAAGSAITFRELQPSTRQAARDLAAAVVEGLRTPAAAA